jgi:hypothetical protein
MLCSDRARSGKSAKYAAMSSESASGTPSSVKLIRVAPIPRSEMYEYPAPPAPDSLYAVTEGASRIISGTSCP